MEERRKVRVQTRDGREDGAQMSYGLMIETNFDNCFDLCIVFRMKIVSDVLLLSYLDKFGLSVTVEAGPALAVLYSEARLYKGPRLAGLSQSTTTVHVLQATSPCGYRKSATATHFSKFSPKNFNFE